MAGRRWIEKRDNFLPLVGLALGETIGNVHASIASRVFSSVCFNSQKRSVEVGEIFLRSTSETGGVSAGLSGCLRAFSFSAYFRQEDKG